MKKICCPTLVSRRAATVAVGGSLLGCAAKPQQSGFDAERLQLLQAQLRSHTDLRAFLMERGGSSPFAYYRPDTGPSTQLDVASVTKSVLALLVGIAIDRGAIAGVQEPLAAFFPEHANGPQASALARVTLRHLLTLSSGFDRGGLDANTDYPEFERRLYAPDLLAHALGRRLVREPGTEFYYSNIDAHLVAVMLSRRLKKPLLEFARDELFRPLGIEAFHWPVGHDGVPNGAARLQLAPADLMRLGRMVRDGGRWQGRQIVPESFVRAATSRQGPSNITPRGNKDLWGYGYLWWTSSTPGDDLPAFYAVGYGGQFIYVVPKLDLVVAAATTQASREVANRTAAIVREFALPAVLR